MRFSRIRSSSVAGFNLLLLAFLALDLLVFHRKAHAIALKEAAIWTALWTILGLAFNAGVFLVAGA